MEKHLQKKGLYKKFLYLLISTLIFNISISKGQERNISKAQEKIISNQGISMSYDSIANEFEKISGTYQIQMIGTRNLPLIPNDLYKTVNANRLKDKRNFIKLSDEMTLMILSEIEIQKKQFIPIKERVAFINNTNN